LKPGPLETFDGKSTTEKLANLRVQQPGEMIHVDDNRILLTASK
jgi:hypothetical protein